MQERRNELLKELAKIIKRKRKQYNKSISQLSNEIELSKSVWSRMEKGYKDIQFSTLWRVAEALDIKLSSLVSEIETEIGQDFSFLENIPAKDNK